MIALLLIYFFGLLTALLILYSGYQLYLSLVCSQQLKAQRLQPANALETKRLAKKSLPPVTFQIALFNEGYVVETLFSALLKLNYPKQLIEIQLLDDSTDASVEINAEWIRQFNAFGFEAVHLRRQHRKGFKAGALNEGLKKAKGKAMCGPLTSGIRWRHLLAIIVDQSTQETSQRLG